MKIIIATGIYPPEIGGPATYAVLVETELKKRGNIVKVLPFRVVKKYPSIVRHFLYFIKVLKMIFWADVVLAQDTVSVGLPSILASKILRKPIVIRVPGDFAWEQGVQRFKVKENIDDFQKKKYGFRVELLRSIQKFVIKKANFVITPSNYLKNIVSNWGVKDVNLARVYNGVSIPERIFLKEFSKKTIVSSGRLVPWKGFDILINCIAKVDANLIIIGDGGDKERLEKLVRENNVSEKVSFTGSLKREELLSYISGSNLFVLPSSFESFSFQLVEAMMLGSVVVALDAGNLKEIIKNGENGILIDQKDIDKLPEILNTLLNDKNLTKKLSENAKEDSKKFNVDATVNELESIFKKII